jgi:hypothetical protein
MTGKLRNLEAYRPYLLIAAVTVVAHGLILLNQGVYWDDWLNYTFAVENRWQNLYSDFFLLEGRPMYAVLFWFLGFFPDPIVAHRWLTLGLLVGTGCLIYAIGISTKWLTSFESVALAILTIVYPAFKVAFGFTLFPYVLSYFLFVLGAWLSFTMVNHTAGSRRVLLRIFSLLIFALSFTVESFLVFYYWFLGLLFITVIDKGQPVSYYIKRLIHFADYALLPFVYWTVDWYAFPVGDIFAQQHWNTIQVNLTTIGDVFYRFIRYAIWQPLSNFHVLVWLFVLAALSLPRLSWDLKLGKGRRDYFIVLVGIAGLLFGILPYALIGKAPGPEGWETRHALLIGLPVALTLIGLLRLGFSGQQQSGVVVFSIVAVLVAGFSYDLLGNYMLFSERRGGRRPTLD